MLSAETERTGWFAVAPIALAMALVSATAFAQVGFAEIKPPDDAVEYSSIYNAVFFVSDTIGFLVGEQSLEYEKATVAITHDKGSTWEVTPGLSVGRLMGGAFVDENTGWAVGAAGTILATTDGGASWDTQTSKVTVDIQDAFFLTDKIGWAVGNNSTALGTKNGGRSWQILSGGTPSGQVGEGEVTFVAAHFFDEKNGIVAGAGIEGVIEVTTDGGKTWEPVHPWEDNYGSLAFADANTGWAVGKYGLIHATTDGGKTWTPQDSSTEEDIWAISAVSPTTAWYSGDLGTIGYTTDGGATWQTVGVQVEFFGQKKDLTRPINGISAVGSKAWAVTDYGRVLYFELQ